MKLLTALALCFACVAPVAATPQSPDYIHGGQCAGDRYSKCRYTLDIINPDEQMVVVPGLEWMGEYRVSTVEFCEESQETNPWDQLITDADFDLMEGCLIDMR